MSAEMIIAESRFGSPVGVLDDGTPFYAPIGEPNQGSAMIISADTTGLPGRAS